MPTNPLSLTDGFIAREQKQKKYDLLTLAFAGIVLFTGFCALNDFDEPLESKPILAANSYMLPDSFYRKVGKGKDSDATLRATVATSTRFLLNNLLNINKGNLPSERNYKFFLKPNDTFKKFIETEIALTRSNSTCAKPPEIQAPVVEIRDDVALCTVKASITFVSDTGKIAYVENWEFKLKWDMKLEHSKDSKVMPLTVEFLSAKNAK